VAAASAALTAKTNAALDAAITALATKIDLAVKGWGHSALASSNVFTFSSGVGARRAALAEISTVHEFPQLDDEWERDTLLDSVVAKMAMHPAYQRIIGMGAPAVPLILARLRQQPRQWFWALTAITSEDPATGLDEARAAADAWIEWGRTLGLIDW
jgi:hypothetical protein